MTLETVLIRKMPASGETLGASPTSSSLICTLANSQTTRVLSHGLA